jgi:hypothetical protein
MSKELPAKTLKLHTNAHAVRDRPTLKDGDERIFRNGLFCGLSSNTSNYSKMSNKVKPDLTRFSLDHVDHSKIFTNSKTDTDKTNNSTEMKSSEDMEQSRVPCEHTKVELTVKTSAILPKNNLQYYVSHEDRNIANLFLLLTSFLLIISLLSGNILAISFSMFIVIAILFVCVRLQQSINVLTSLENDCNLFEKAVPLSADVIIINKNYMSKHECLRSRYVQFLVSDSVINKPKAIQRDREPSRIPIKQLTRVMNKSRNVRKVIRTYQTYIAKNVPMSSRIHCYVNKCDFNQSSYFYARHHHQHDGLVCI